MNSKDPRESQDTQNDSMKPKGILNDLKNFEMTRGMRSKPITRDALWLRRASKNIRLSTHTFTSTKYMILKKLQENYVKWHH